jgi:carboxyl-terminal processing protease
MHKLLLLSSISLLIRSGIAQTLYPTRVNENAETYVNYSIRGIWKSIGDNYLLDADQKKITLFSTTSKHCYPETNDYLTDLLNTKATFCLNKTSDTLSIFYQDFAEKTRQLQTENKYYRLRELPHHCTTLTKAQKQNPEFLFDLFWMTLKENYAFAAERNLNWNRIYQDYRPKIGPQATTHDLFDVMGQIVTLTKDQHTKIIAEDGQTNQYSGVPTARLLRESFEQQDSIKTFDLYANEFFYTNYQHISNDLLQGKGKKGANGKIEWGDLTPTIGYIHVHSLARFAANELSRKQHLDTLDYCMAQIMRSFQDKKAIIVDVSFNFGGYDAAGLTIAGYFTKTAHHAYTTYKFQDGKFYKSTEFKVHPAANYNFTKPVYLLTTDISRSAAESFALQMKSLPNVKTVGTNTLGILSDMLNKSIGNYVLTTSNEKYVTPDGKMYEVTGVDADIKLEVFPKDNMFNGHRDAVKKIVEMVEKELN